MKFFHGDCLEKMKEIGDGTIDSIVTDPPYGLSFMGKGWDRGVPPSRFWVEALRVAKPGSHLLAFGGTRTYHRLAIAIEDAGWEIRDCVMWVYGSGFPKSHNLKDEWRGWGTALKPAYEPIIVARKSLISTIAENVQKHGTGGINVDGCRVGTDERYNPAAGNKVGGNSLSMSLTGMPKDTKGRVAFGRWPANLIHDGSDEVVGLFPATISGGGDKHSKTQDGNIFKGIAPISGLHSYQGDSGSAARFFYCAKASKADRDEGCENLEVAKQDPTRKEGNPGGDNPRNRGVHKRTNFHPTVKPTALMRYLCRLVTPPNGIVFDPFMGSGSTGKAAVLEGFDFVGIEKEVDYLKIAEARIAKAKSDKQEQLL